jgi:hypothetical protein
MSEGIQDLIFWIELLVKLYLALLGIAFTERPLLLVQFSTCPARCSALRLSCIHHIALTRRVKRRIVMHTSSRHTSRSAEGTQITKESNPHVLTVLEQSSLRICNANLRVNFPFGSAKCGKLPSSMALITSGLNTELITEPVFVPVSTNSWVSKPKVTGPVGTRTRPPTMVET